MLISNRNIRWHFKSCLMSVEKGLGHNPATGYHGCGSKHRFGVHQKELAIFTDTGGKGLENLYPGDKTSQRGGLQPQ